MPKLLFVTTLPFYPDASGGSEKSSTYLFDRLRQLGWQIEVICGVSRRSPYYRRAFLQSLRRFQKPSYTVIDEDLGYPCWRQVKKFTKKHQWIELLDQRLREYQPDVVLSHYRQADPPFLNHAALLGFPSFYFVRWLSNMEAGFIFPDNIHLIANSPFTASYIEQYTRNEVGVVLPFVDVNQYKVTKRERQYITFINPVPPKGLNVAVEVARSLPQERFLFVKGKWGLYSTSQLEAFMKPVYQLPNVEVWNHQLDMHQVYAMTDILLVPSQFSETFGRIIIEAQVNGIPVVAANVGGIPYTLGRGGLLANPVEDSQPYINALRQLRTDDTLYRQLSTFAFENSQRPEFEPQYQVEKFIHFVENRINVVTS